LQQRINQAITISDKPPNENPLVYQT